MTGRGRAARIRRTGRGRFGFTATREMNDRDVGVNGTAAIQGSGGVVGDQVTIARKTEAVLPC